MKKIIVLLLLTFSFSQQELIFQDITVSVDRNTQSIDINDYLTLVSGYYTVEPLFVTVNQTTIDDWSLQFISVVESMRTEFGMQYQCEDSNTDCWIQIYDNSIVNNQNSVITCGWPDDHWLNETISFDLVLRVSGIFDTSSLHINDDSNIVYGYSLDKPYPNPFNPNTTISFAIPIYDFVSIKVYDVMGRLVSTLVEENFNSGTHTLIWNGASYSSGEYFIKMESSNYNKTQIVTLIK
tara:strand:- start:83 stop:796 length:714 start_codon:yes stop_codon:yes gene_type:complete